MSEEIIKQEQSNAVQLDPDTISILRTTAAKGLSDPEFKAF